MFLIVVGHAKSSWKLYNENSESSVIELFHCVVKVF